MSVIAEVVVTIADWVLTLLPWGWGKHDKTSDQAPSLNSVPPDREASTPVPPAER